ncbi:hypothetical protein [Sphaerisporangium perillae]|uniref:hypothetical protein n=1 Tax=Sphaerisporangium perillae TaxID=2935860 RepID=UPI00200D2142|nr:hypothetical protein [Sphaerisporangium perillae]
MPDRSGTIIAALIGAAAVIGAAAITAGYTKPHDGDQNPSIAQVEPSSSHKKSSGPKPTRVKSSKPTDTGNGNGNGNGTNANTNTDPDTCISGFVWREAVPNDRVCVTPQVREQTRMDNQAAAERVDPNGASGPDSCISGFVWREAVADDHVCVTPEQRSQAASDNSQASARRVGG